MTTNFQLLCYKHWLESRARFFIALFLLLAITIYAINGAEDTIINHPSLHLGRKINFTQYVWVIILKGEFLTIFTIATFLFGIGGINQENQSGTSHFTLSLPVFRRTVTRSKLLVSALQVFVLSIASILLIPIVATLYGFSYPIKDALLFSCLMSGGGLLFMILGNYLSFFITKQMAAIPLGLSLLAIVFFVTKLPALEEVNIFSFMVGAGYLDNNNFLFKDTINFGQLMMILAVTCGAALLMEQFVKKIDL
jgi:ABC-type transport system involved in multi-copper enzyme maturation permease subunit